MEHKIVSKLIVCSVFVLFSSPNFAGPITPGVEWDISNSCYGGSACAFEDQTFVMGYMFRVDSTVTIGSLGAYDYGMDGLEVAHAVGLWNSDGSSLLATAQVASGTGSTLVGNFRYADLNVGLLTLSPGDYVVGAFDYGTNETYAYNVNALTSAPGITYIEDRLTPYGGGNPPLSSLSLEYPGLTQSNEGGGGWFGANIGIVVVPEPGTLALFGLGIAGMGLARRKGRYSSL